MLKIAYSGLLNAQIACTVIWISSWKLHFSSVAEALLDQSMQDQSSRNIMARNYLGSVLATILHFQNLAL